MWRFVHVLVMGWEWSKDKSLMRLKGLFLGCVVLAGCGGGGSDGGQSDQTFPEPAIFRAPLESLPAATLTSEEDEGWANARCFLG